MNASQKPATRADREAADWFARLGSTSVSTEAIHEFFEWRKAPDNAEAYKRIEQHWKRMERLQGDPDINAMLSDVGAKPKAKPLLTKRVLLSGALAMIAAGAAATVWWTTTAPQTYETGVGEQRSLQLADGSFVRLDTDSEIRVKLTADRRRIELVQGQALFDVAHDAARPFTVSAGDATVTALGTVFDVRLTGATTQVVLVKGRVRVEAAGGPDQILNPDQTARTTRQGAKTTTIDAAAATSWTEGRLVFSGVPLARAVAEVNRYLVDKIEIDAPEVLATPISGTYRAGDRSAFVSAASEIFELTPEPQADGAIKLVPRRTKNL
jgi:transmembrane sensor